MALVAFVFVGAVLLINGLVLLGVVPPRSSVPLNLLVGTALAATALQIVLTTDAAGPSSTPAPGLWAAAGFTLFSFAAFFLAQATPLTWSQRPADALAVMQSITTATVPALLDLAGWWRQVPVALVLGVQVAVVVVYAALLAAERRRAGPLELTSEPADPASIWHAVS